MVDALRLQTLALGLRELAQPPLDDDWIPLLIGDERIGLLRPSVASFLQQRCGLAFTDGGVRLPSDEPAALAAKMHTIAQRLQKAGLLAGWRNELLDVRAGAAQAPLASVERAACRPLGLPTVAVHLNAFVDSDALLVARRADHKAIDPGRWDNLVGGMVPAGEDLLQALQREAWEEAGLRLDLTSLQRGRWFEMRRPVPEGLQAEIIHVFDIQLPADTPLANQDGEVAVIETRSTDDVVSAIERGEFTAEAALATLESLMRRRSIAAPAGLFH